MDTFLAALKSQVPEVEVEQASARVALTKCSFRIGQTIDLAQLRCGCKL